MSLRDGMRDEFSSDLEKSSAMAMRLKRFTSRLFNTAVSPCNTARCFSRRCFKQGKEGHDEKQSNK
jgi:hypothetical protein